MDIVAVGAHPDDIEIGAGGTIALHRKQGDSVTFLLLTKGGKIARQNDRERETVQAAGVLNVDNVRFLGFEDTNVPYGPEAVTTIEDHVREIDPDRMYVHSKEDTHQDHRKSALSSVAATRNVPEVFAYESPSTRSSFSPEYFIPFSEDILKMKVEAIQTHESQSEKHYLEADAMEGLARFRGRQANARYAESFQIIRFVEQLGPGDQGRKR